MARQLETVIPQILGEAVGIAQPQSTRTLDDVTFHDFGRYEFLLNPSDLGRIDIEQLSEDAVAYLDQLESGGTSLEALEYVADMLTRLEAAVRTGCADGLKSPPTSTPASLVILYLGLLPIMILRQLYKTNPDLIPRFAHVIQSNPKVFQRLYKEIRARANSMQKSAYATANAFPDSAAFPLFDWRDFVQRAGKVAFTVTVHDHREGGTTTKVEVTETQDPVYGLPEDIENRFEVYPERSVNVGTALLYRQRWRIIGKQPGEVVRTIPLGPGQSEKIITKITRRRKVTSNMERSSESETSTESTDTTKDSSEIVNEASSKFEGSVEASASYGVGGIGFGGSASASATTTKDKASKNTTSSLSETMQKTASKIRRQSKVTIATESEYGMESEATSEVKNTNDEVPLTLEYHMLQHQYEVYTYLWSVRNAIFVAEELPAPFEVDANWVRRHDWIIARELLDESYRSILNELIQDVDEEDLIDFESGNNPFRQMFNTARKSFAKFTANGVAGGGLEVPDIYAKPQDAFEGARAAEVARRRQNRIRDVRRRRLFRHISDNLLHYCRGIWAREDNEQRLLRYRKEGRTVPMFWQGPAMQGSLDVSQFQPLGPGAPVDEVIADMQPIGFTGNYVVFELKPIDSEDDDVSLDTESESGNVVMPLAELLNVVRSAYTDPSGTALRDPAFDLFLDEAEALLTADEDALKKISDSTVFDFVSFLPEHSAELVDSAGNVIRLNGELLFAINADQWAEYLFRRNATRRFLVDSNNLYVSLLLGGGVALEPFKRAHRFIDVLKAEEERKAAVLKNMRRDLLKDKELTFDPDIDKVVVVPGSTSAQDVVGGVIGGGTDPDET